MFERHYSVGDYRHYTHHSEAGYFRPTQKLSRNVSALSETRVEENVEVSSGVQARVR